MVTKDNKLFFNQLAQSCSYLKWPHCIHLKLLASSCQNNLLTHKLRPLRLLAFYFHALPGQNLTRSLLSLASLPLYLRATFDLQYLQLLRLRAFKIPLQSKTFSKSSIRKWKNGKKETLQLKQNKQKKPNKIKCCLESPTSSSPHHPYEVPSLHHSSGAQRCGTVERNPAGQLQSVCRALQAATWQGFLTVRSLSSQPRKAKWDIPYHTADNTDDTCTDVIPGPGIKPQGCCPTIIHREMSHFPKMLSAVTFRRLPRTVLKTSRRLDKLYNFLFIMRMLEEDINFYDSSFWIGIYAQDTLIPYVWLNISSGIRMSQEHDTHSSQVHLTSKINSLVINLPQQATNKLSCSQKQKRSREVDFFHVFRAFSF